MQTHILRNSFRKALATLLATALPFQLISSCGPASPRREPVSHVLGSKTELDFERQHDTSTSLREGGGWSSVREASGRYGADVYNHVAPQVYSQMTVVYVCVGDECDSDLPSDLPTTPFGYGVQDHDVRIYLDGTVPPKGQGAPKITKRSGPGPGGDSSDADHKNRPGFPLNPGNLKTRLEVDKDIAARLKERESKATSRRAELNGQLSRSSKKTGTAPKGGLKGEADEARARHSQSAGDVADVIDDAGGAPTRPETPLPGSLGQDLVETRKEAKRLGNAPPNDHSKEAARAASDLLDDAQTEARDGNVARAEGLVREGKWLTSIAGRGPGGTPDPAPNGPIPPKDGPSPRDNDEPRYRMTRTPSETRSEAMRVGLSLYDASSELRGFGLHEMADKALAAGHFLVEVAIGAARLSGAVDMPLSVMEAFGGVTLGVNAKGEIAFREATMLEKAFAFAALGAAGLAFGAGGWAAVVGVGVIGGIGKAATKGLERRLGAEAAEEAAEAAAKNAPKVVEKLGNKGIEVLEGALKNHPRINTPEKVRNVIETFENGQLEHLVPQTEVIVHRWHDAPGGKARPKGSFVTPENIADPIEARERLAILENWSGMTEKSTFRVKPGTDLFVGKTAPQGPYNGGAIQYFIANPEEALELIK